MKKIIYFTKMVATGNDFVVMEERFLPKAVSIPRLASLLCDRKYGIGADGLLVLGKSRSADLRMRIFNADGSQAEMCGNGARCAAWFWVNAHSGVSNGSLSLQTLAGKILAEVNQSEVRVRLSNPKDIYLGKKILLNNRKLSVDFVNTGVPHTVILSEGLKKIDVAGLGRLIRNHQAFAPRGTNVNFVEPLSKDKIAVRTYERGVEDETLACGTGSSASAIIFALKSGAKSPVKVITESGEELKIFFQQKSGTISDVWLQGKVSVVYKGVYHV